MGAVALWPRPSWLTVPTRRPPRAPCRPSDPPSLHERLIRGLLDGNPNVCRNGFWEAVSKLAAELGEDGPLDRARYGFLPDAYLIDRENCEIVLYEVEVTGRLTDCKLRNLGNFWAWWDGSGEHDWLPRLILVDRFGNHNEIGLQERSYA